MRQQTAANFYSVRMRRALEGIDHQIEQDLYDIGAVHADRHIFDQRVDDQFIVLPAWVYLSQMSDIREQLVDPNPWPVVGVASQEAQIPPRNLDTICTLPRNRLKPVANKFQIVHFKARRTAD